MHKMISNLNKIGTAFLLFFCMSASEIAGQAKLLGLEHFSPQLGDLDLLLENQKIFSGPICLLPTEGAASFMYTQFWHEYDWRIVGKRRIRMSETGDVAFWKVVDKIGFFERFHESRILESWQKFVEFGKKDLDGTITFLMSVWKRPQPGLTRYEADLIPFLVHRHPMERGIES